MLPRRNKLALPDLHARRGKQNQSLESMPQSAAILCLEPKLLPGLVRLPIITVVEEIYAPVKKGRLVVSFFMGTLRRLSSVAMALGIANRMRLPARQIGVGGEGSFRQK